MTPTSTTRGRLYAGTSGFAYRQWKPDFYPAKLKNAEMLRYYAERLPSVEINNTFYRMPSEALLAGWSRQTPATFAFSLKAPQRITHVARLHDVAEPLRRFLDAARGLGERLGCLLFQCPPYLRYDRARLESFLAGLPEEGFRFAMEFRHASWNDDEVRAALAARRVAWCSVDGDGPEPDVVQTTKEFVYLRLRKPSYDEAALAAWAARFRGLLSGGTDVYVYFKHEDDPSGVRYANRILADVGSTG